MRLAPALLAVLLSACGAPSAPDRGLGEAAAPRASFLASVRSAPEDAPPSAPPSAASSAPALPSIPAPKPPSGEGRAEAAERVLFLATHLRTDDLRKVCPAAMEEEARVRCLLSFRYADDAASRELVFTLYNETGSLAGLLPEETTSDGRGGKVRLLPARPVGANRQHLSWIIEAFRSYKSFAAAVGARGPISFRDRPVDFRFFYSEKGGMPSAFAATRNIGYNLFGALNMSDVTVRDTLFHELFHLNDGWRGDWSRRALAPIYDEIIARCGRRSACLSPYAPTDTKIAGVVYAFAPQGGVREYAAELALRYFREHRLVIDNEPLPARAFKCGPAENAAAWKLLSDEFFGGVDLVPPCGE
ncbi:MAG: hypothetical protein HUU21_23015 [Polyangiaceae bacterium]|nr:hypothetical protein [Polyangiaceae bacterium]